MGPFVDGEHKAVGEGRMDTTFDELFRKEIGGRVRRRGARGCAYTEFSARMCGIWDFGFGIWDLGKSIWTYGSRLGERGTGS